MLKQHDLRHTCSSQRRSVSTLQLMLLPLDDIMISHLQCWYLIDRESTAITPMLIIDVLLQVRVVELRRSRLIGGLLLLLFIVVALGYLLVSLRDTWH